MSSTSPRNQISHSWYKIPYKFKFLLSTLGIWHSLFQPKTHIFIYFLVLTKSALQSTVLQSVEEIWNTLTLPDDFGTWCIKWLNYFEVLYKNKRSLDNALFTNIYPVRKKLDQVFPAWTHLWLNISRQITRSNAIPMFFNPLMMEAVII